MKIARVFPTKTSMSPVDPLAFYGPPTLEAYRKQSRTKHRRPAGAIGRMRDYVHSPS